MVLSFIFNLPCFSAVKTGLKLAGLGGLEHLEEDEDKKPFACDYNGCNKRYVKQSHLEVNVGPQNSNHLKIVIWSSR